MTLFIYPRGSSEGHREGSRWKMSPPPPLAMHTQRKCPIPNDWISICYQRKIKGRVFIRCWGHRLKAYWPRAGCGRRAALQELGTEEWSCASRLPGEMPWWRFLPSCSDFGHLGTDWLLLSAVMPIWYETIVRVILSVFTFCVPEVTSYIRAEQGLGLPSTWHGGISAWDRATVALSAEELNLAVHAEVPRIIFPPLGTESRQADSMSSLWLSTLPDPKQN